MAHNVPSHRRATAIAKGSTTLHARPGALGGLGRTFIYEDTRGGDEVPYHGPRFEMDLQCRKRLKLRTPTRKSFGAEHRFGCVIG